MKSLKSKILAAILCGTMLFSAVGFTACTNGDLEAKIAELQAQITELQDQNQDLQADIAEQQEQITQLEQENEELKEEIADLQNQIINFEEKNNIAKYNAMILNDAQQYVKEEFLEENLTRGAIFGEIDTSNESFPLDISYLIKNQEEFNNIFNQLPLSVNFAEEMLFVYIFTDIYAGYDCEIKKIESEGNNLHIEILHNMAEPDENGAVPPSASMPTLKYVAIRLMRLDVDNLQITMIYD